jgi:two-component system, OmpR family, sensor kinase
MKTAVKRFSFLCNTDGRILEVLHVDKGLFNQSLNNKLVFSLISPGDMHKLLDFFLELKEKGASIGSQMMMRTTGGPEPFSLFGAKIYDLIGFAGATNEDEAKKLLQDFTWMSNEQTNIIRKLSKEQHVKKEKLSSSSGDAKIYDPSGNPGSLESRDLSFYEDMSRLNNELTNMQRELSKKNRELDLLNEQKNKFLGIAAHDLRNPLGILIGFSELMLNMPEDLDVKEQRDLLERIHKTATFMLKMVNELLDVASIESGKLNLTLEAESINALVREIISMQQLLAREKKIELLFHPIEKDIVVTVDRGKIEQVLANLISNALKFSNPKTTIVVSVMEEAGEVRILVADQGHGIAEEELNHLFQYFQRTSTQSTSGERSTGLGLAIAKKIIEAHGGTIGVESIQGKGSTFFFTLPLV